MSSSTWPVERPRHRELRLDLLAAGDDDVGALGLRREDLVERLLDRVREDERPGDHRHAQQDGDDGQRGAELARREPAERQACHASAFIWSRICSASRCGSSATMWPSSRKITRSATEAAVGVVGDHDDGLAELVDRAPQQREDLLRGRRVEVAGRLVGEDHGGLGGERARHRDALLLAAGELGGPVRAAVGERDRLEQLLDAPVAVTAAGERQREPDVLLGGEDRDEVEGLEDEADLVAAQAREVAVVELADLGAADGHGAVGRAVEPGEHVHERRLAGPGRAHDRGERAGLDLQRDTAERVDGGVTLAVALGQVLSCDDGVGHADRVANRQAGRWCG